MLHRILLGKYNAKVADLDPITTAAQRKYFTVEAKRSSLKRIKENA